MNSQKLYSIVKRFLADLTGRKYQHVLADMVFRDDPPKGLGFPDANLGSLANDLNEHFKKLKNPISPPLVPNDALKSETVGDLYDVIRKRIPKENT